MNLQQRKELLIRLGNYMQTADEEWQTVKKKAFADNRWFIPEFVDRAVTTIARLYLNPEALDQLADHYAVPPENPEPKKIGIVMAGNIPLVGFHDLLCVFLSGNHARIKPSSKDEIL